MRSIVALACLISCAEPASQLPPPPPPPPPPQDPLRFPALPCPPHTRAPIGTSDCAPVGPGPCEAPFESDGTEWGCRAIRAAESCAGAAMPRMGAVECRPVGWSACPAGFGADDRGTCIDSARSDCSGASRTALDTSACVPIGDCGRALPLDAMAVPADYATIGAAIAAAAPGAVIAIDSGTYAEAIVIDRPVTLIGRCAGEVMVETAVGPVLVADVAAEISGVTLRGGEIGVQVSSAVTLSEVVIEGTTYGGAVAVGRGASLSIARSAIRAVRSDANGARGRGVSAEEGGSIALDEVEIADVQEAGAAAIDEGSRLAIARSAIFRVAQSGAGNGGQGVVAGFGGDATIALAVVAESRGVLVTGAGSEVTASDLWIRDAPGEGIGLWVEDGARFTGERIAIRRALGSAIAAVDAGTEVSLVDASILDTRPTAAGFSGGFIAVEDAILRLERCRIEGSSIGGAAATGGLVDLRESVIRGGRNSIGVFAMDRGQLAISGSALLEHQLSGISVEESSAVIEDSLIGGLAEPLGLNSTGVDIHGASEARIDRSAIFGFEGQGVLVKDTSSATVTDSLIEAIRIGPEDAATGAGALDGGRLALVRARIEDIDGLGVLSESGPLTVDRCAILSARDVTGLTPAGIAAAGEIWISDTAVVANTGVGVIVGPGGVLTMERSLVADTIAQADGRFGHAVVAESATVSISSSTLIGNASVAGFFDASRALVNSVLIAQNGIGVHAQSGSELLEAPAREPTGLEVIFTGSVVLFENATRVGTGELPLPQPFR